MKSFPNLFILSKHQSLGVKTELSFFVSLFQEALEKDAVEGEKIWLRCLVNFEKQSPSHFLFWAILTFFCLHSRGFNQITTSTITAAASRMKRFMKAMKVVAEVLALLLSFRQPIPLSPCSCSPSSSSTPPSLSSSSPLPSPPLFLFSDLTYMYETSTSPKFQLV